MLTANQILEKKIITLDPKVAEDFNIELEPAQMAIDLHVTSCDKVVGEGFIPKKGKTVIASTLPQTPVDEFIDGKMTKVWKLSPGDYEIGFAEGCNFPLNAAGRIVHRSSLRRNCVEINSPLWDPNFHTERMGTFMVVRNPIIIEVRARVAQMIVFTSDEEATAYQGQWMGTSTQAVDKANGTFSH